MALAHRTQRAALLLGLALAAGAAGAAPTNDEQPERIDPLEGITASVGLVMVGQNASGDSTASGDGESQLNYRGDVAVTLPGGGVGRVTGTLFAHLRVGQGEGLAELNGSFGAPNATSFATGTGDASPVLAQVWYQMEVPLGDDGTGAGPGHHLEITVGKIDPFLFFDQNTVADDETTRFMNSLFVHNPLLDAGGDVGVGSDGATPGVRVAYHNEEGAPQWWNLSLGLFGAGSGGDFDRSFNAPFLIAQLEAGCKLFGGLDGNYRLYGWSNGQASDFAGNAERHGGWGLSVDQRVGDAITLFGRYGASTAGEVAFDQAVTVGAELGGSYWDALGDAIGLAFAALRPGNAYRDANPGLDHDEQTLELYYRWRLNDQVAITPSLQQVNNGAGDGDAREMRFIGLRTHVTF